MSLTRKRMFGQTTAVRGVREIRDTSLVDFQFRENTSDTDESALITEALADTPTTATIGGVTASLDSIQSQRLSARRGVTITRYSRRSGSTTSNATNKALRISSGRVSVPWLVLPVKEGNEAVNPVAAFENAEADDAWDSTWNIPDGRTSTGGLYLNRAASGEPTPYPRSIPIFILSWQTLLNTNPLAQIDGYLLKRVNQSAVAFTSSNGQSFTIPAYCGFFESVAIAESGNQFIVAYEFFVRPDPWTEQRVNMAGTSAVYVAMSRASNWTDPGFPVAA